MDMKETIIRPSTLYTVTNAVLNLANRRLNGLIKRYMEKQLYPQREPVDFPRRYRKRVHIHQEIFRSRPVYTVSPNGKTKSAKAIVFLHGGGGVMAPTTLHFNMAVTLSEKTECLVYFVMYPLAPKVNAKEAVKWLKAWYAQVIRENPNRDYYVIGDSAGANLSAALCSGETEKIKGVILISPVPGIDEMEKTMPKYEDHDILLSMNLLKNIARLWGKDMDLKDPDINISFVDFKGFPKTMLIFGAREIFADAVPELIDKMRNAGVDLAVYKGEIHCHDWVLADVFPESKRMIAEICTFISE